MTVRDLPAPDAVLGRATRVAEDTRPGLTDVDTVNVVVAGDPAPEPVTTGDDGYVGETAGAVGRLAAAAAAVEAGPGVLHHPEPTYTAAGPWVVVEPLDDRLATVAKGTGIVEVTIAAPTGFLDQRLTTLRDRLTAVLEASRPTHDRYPVDRDEGGVFTTGLTTFDLESVSVGDPITVTFAMTTTPTTSAESVRSRFQAVDGVETVAVTVDHGVERGTPPDWLRRAAETAADTVFGDWAYEWLPGPSLFTRVPDPAKLAVGTGTPGTPAYDADAYTKLRTLLEALLTAETHP